MYPFGRSLVGSGIGMLFLGLVGCQDASGPDAASDGPQLAAAETEKTVSVEQLESTEFVPCAGENVHWTGTLTLTQHGVTNRGLVLQEGQFQHTIFQGRVSQTGLGETSGASYSFNSIFHLSGQSESPVNQFPIVLRVSSRDLVFGPTGSPIGFARFSSMLVVNGNGRLVMDEANFTTKCR
jgi:hypothetical protein